ncbi:unnamed protein product [Pieris macdunnoughi]|uniref:C2H2-type domain-containing protein n=2 Tax=Pieris macdunnoughi TaxID=345717 RepID=A0A821KYE7_9NEOP|nr:unnamed protein product [Pieris macdunnoughi]
MDYCCSQCSFSSQFQSALLMHKQLHHSAVNPIKSMPGVNGKSSFTNIKGIKLPSRTMSATKLFEKLRTRLCRSKTLFSHPEENVLGDFDFPQSECTSKALKESFSNEAKDVFSCHLCSFNADRITVLDRHLLNDHKIGLDNLLKLVMAKTKNGLEDDKQLENGTRQPYYQLTENEYVIETVTPKIKILKHVAVNTDLTLIDVEMTVDKMDDVCEKDVFSKMKSLNEYMCKFVDSSNTLKRVLTKEMDQKRSNRSTVDPLELGDRDSPHGWEKACSETIGRNRRNRDSRSDKLKLSSDSFYF